MFRKLTEGTFKFFEWFMYLALVNVLWLLFTIVGLGLFGWAPATAAAFGVVRKMLLSPDEDFPLFRTFLAIYRKDFIRANLLGFIMLICSFSLFFSGAIMNEMTHAIFPKILLLAVAFLFVMILILIFPVFCHYHLSIQQSIRHSLVIGLANLHYLFFIAILLLLLFIIFGTLPAIMIFYLVSLPILVIMFFCLKIFQKIEEQMSR